MKKWQEILGPSNEVIVSSLPWALSGLGGGGVWCADPGSFAQVAQVEKFSESSGLGISLEATSGHHYIRSVLPEGPVGRCGKLFSGDELLEVGVAKLVVLLPSGPQLVSASCPRSTESL